jgi:hypothetical protein
MGAVARHGAAVCKFDRRVAPLMDLKHVHPFCVVSTDEVRRPFADSSSAKGHLFPYQLMCKLTTRSVVPLEPDPRFEQQQCGVKDCSRFDNSLQYLVGCFVLGKVGVR